MKKFFSLITLLAIMSQFVVTVSASTPTPWMVDDFNNFSAGDDYQASPDAKYPNAAGKAGELFVANDNDGEGNYVIIDKSLNVSKSAGIAVKGGAEHNGIVTISFDVRIVKDGPHYYVQDEKGSYIFCMMIRESPYYFMGGQSTNNLEYKYPSCRIPAQKWINMTTVIDFDKDTIDVYCDGFQIVNDEKPRMGQSINSLGSFRVYNNGDSAVISHLRNIKCYDGEVVPPMTDYAKENFVIAETPLVNFSDGFTTIKTELPDAKAVFAGYPVAYNAGTFELVKPLDRELAPIKQNGYIYIPADYAAKLFDATYNRFEGKITKGSVTKTFTKDVVSDISPVAPIVVRDELFIPVCSELASAFGTTVYIDDRDLAIFGVSQKPGEEIVKPLISELRGRSTVFGKGINAEVFYSSRSYRKGTADVWNSLDAAKRFMATSNRWTYTNTGDDRKKLDDLGILNQSTLNPNCTTYVYETDANGNVLYGDDKKPIVKKDANGVSIYWGSARRIDGNIRFRTSDGLQNWGCVNNPFYIEDTRVKIQDATAMGSYLWQFDDYPHNANYEGGGCFCEYCMDAFASWLTKNGYDFDTLVSKNALDSSDKEWIDANGGIEKFNYKKYLLERRGLLNAETGEGDFDVFMTNISKTKANGGISEIHSIFKAFTAECVDQFFVNLRATMKMYADENGIESFLSGNMSNFPQQLKTEGYVAKFDYLDGGMGETVHKNTTADAIFGTDHAEQAYDKTYVNSLWAYQGRNSMYFWVSAAALMFATGQNGLIPWDDWVYRSTRYYADLDELEGIYSFVREYPYLLNNYDSPQEVAYIHDMDSQSKITTASFRNFALALAKKGIASKTIATRDVQAGPKYSVDVEDMIGVKQVVNVADVALSKAEIAASTVKGDDVLAMNGRDGDEFSTSYADGTNGAAKYELITDPAGAKKNDKYMSIKATGNATTLRINELIKGLESGKKYEISFYAKAAPGQTNTVSVMSSNAVPAQNTIYPLTTDTNSIAVSDKMWTKVTRDVVIVPHKADDSIKKSAAQKAYDDSYAKDQSAEKAEAAKQAVLNPENWINKGIHVGVTIAGAGTVYIDDFQMREKSDILIDHGYDGVFESATKYTTHNANIEYAITDTQKDSGTKSLYIKNKNAGTSSAIRFNELKAGIEIGKTYKFTFRAKAASGTPKISAMISNSAPATNTLYPQKIINNQVELSTSAWKTVEVTLNIEADTPQNSIKINAANDAYNKAIADNKTEAEAQAAKAAVLDPSTWKKGPIHMGLTISGGGEVYVDNVQMYEIPTPYTYDAATLTDYQLYEQDYWTARMAKDSNGKFPENTFAILRKNTLYENAPVVVHAVSYESAIQKNAAVELNNKYLPDGDTLTIKVYAPRKNPYTKTITKNKSGITTFTIDELDNWTVLEISGDNTESLARFGVDGMSGIGTGTRVSYDYADGTEKDFTITTYGQGINCYTYGDKDAGQDEIGYVYKRIETDDYEVSASVEATTGASGIMIREDVYSNAPTAALMYDSQNGLRLAVRAVVNRGYSYTTLGKSMPAYLKLSVKNNVVTAYSSSNGSDWTKLYEQSVQFNALVAGAFASSATGEQTTCRVTDFTIDGKNAALEYPIYVENLMRRRNPSFVNTFRSGSTDIFVDYVAGYDKLGATATSEKAIESQDNDNASLLLTNRESAQALPVYYRIPVQNGKTYEISAWMKLASEDANETASLDITIPSGTLNGIVYDGTIQIQNKQINNTKLSTEWKRVYTRFTISESGLARGVDFTFKTTGTSDIYIDNIELKEVCELGDGINASFIKYPTRAVIDLSTNDGTTKHITYAIAMKDGNDKTSKRVNYQDLKQITITGETTSIDVSLAKLLSNAEIHLWETDSFSPIIRTINIKQ